MVANDPSIHANSRESSQLPVQGREDEINGRSVEQAVIVRGGLEVYSLDGMLLGYVEEFIIDAAGNLTSFIVKIGSAIDNEMWVLMDWIQTVTRERIQLRITAAEARLSI